MSTVKDLLKIAIGVVILLAIVVFSIVGLAKFVQWTPQGGVEPAATREVVKNTQQRAVVPGTTPDYAATEAAPRATATPQPAACLSGTEFQALVPAGTTTEWPYTLIEALDARPEKISHDTAGWSLTGPAVVWTGSYVEDPSYGGRVQKFSVDGKTGVWIVNPGNFVTFETPGASICLKDTPNIVAPGGNYNGGNDGGQTSTCIATADVVNIINTNKQAGEQMFVVFDELASANPDATFRGLQQNNTIAAGSPLTRLVWLRQGRISGSDPLPLHCSNGMCLYLLVEGQQAQTTWPYRAIVTCSEVNPARDFPWWGK